MKLGEYFCVFVSVQGVFFRVHKEVKAYGFTEFQAEVGGLSGLLLGLSILDIVSKCGRKLCSV